MAAPYSMTHWVFVDGSNYTPGSDSGPFTKLGTDTFEPTTLTDGDDNFWTVDETVSESPLNSSGIFYNGAGNQGSYIGVTEVNGTLYPVFHRGLGDDYAVAFNNAGNAAIFDALPSGTVITVQRVTFEACFAEGTKIATPDGEKPVEALKIGDEVRTADGRAVPVKWIGHQDLFPTNVTPHMQPVRIRADALGPNLPAEDLVVTADHAIYLDGYLINASALVNGTTIDFLPLAECGFRLTVYHVETEAHEVLIANGLTAESYLDQPNRSCFDNYDDYVSSFGEERRIAEMPVPRISFARMLPSEIRARIETDYRRVPQARSA